MPSSFLCSSEASSRSWALSRATRPCSAITRLSSTRSFWFAAQSRAARDESSSRRLCFLTRDRFADSRFDYDTDYDDDDEYEQHRLPASRAAVESLPEAALDEEEAARGCAVCNDVIFAPGQRVVRLPCKHYFHGDCIWPWLAIRSTCPMCRYQLPTDDAESPQAPQLGALVVPVARHGGAQQSGGGDGGDGSQATTGGGDIDVASGHGSTYVEDSVVR